MAKSKYVAGPTFTTPKGPSIWPRLNEPDTKHDAAGVYECKVELSLDLPLVQQIKAKAMELAQAKYDEVMEANPGFLDEAAYAAKVAELTASGKTALIKKLKVLTLVEPMPAEIDDEGDETGTVMIKAKMKASGVYKSGPKTGQRWERKPNIYDAKGNALKNPPKIGGGSIVKMNIELNPYYAASDGKVGTSFRLNAVQVIELVEFGGKSASGFGFGEEDGDDLSSYNDTANDEFGADTNGAASDDDDGL